jgi:hypothetical protein
VRPRARSWALAPCGQIGLGLGLWLGLWAGPTACRPEAETTRAPAPAERAQPEPAARASEPSAERREALHRIQRIGVIGASLSAGFGDGVALHRMLDAALLAPHAIVDASSSGLFLDTMTIAEIEIGVMRLRGVRVVVAVDFLFWFAYGDKPEAARDADLERGLQMLDQLEVPMLVGDLPDVHGASPKMISPRQIPDRARLDAFNARIAAWAKARPRVHLLPMAAWTDALKDGVPASIENVTIGPGDPLLQWDGLHPTARGQAVLVLLVLERLRAWLPGLEAGDVAADPAAVLARFRSAQGWDRLPPPPGPGFDPGER